MKLLGIPIDKIAINEARAFIVNVIVCSKVKVIIKLALFDFIKD